MTRITAIAPIGCPQGVRPEDWRRAIVGRIEALADQMFILVTILDQMDGDVDFEPSLSWGDAGPEALNMLANDDREMDLDSEEADDDPDAEDDDPREDAGDDELTEPDRCNPMGSWLSGGSGSA